MFRIIARMFENGGIVGYKLEDEYGNQKNITKLGVWEMAKKNKILNVEASGSANNPSLSGKNGFELKKLPIIKQRVNTDTEKIQESREIAEYMNAFGLRGLLFSDIIDKFNLKFELTKGNIEELSDSILVEKRLINREILKNDKSDLMYIVGYQIHNVGAKAFNIYKLRLINDSFNLQIEQLKPNEVTFLSKIELALLASSNQVNCKFSSQMLTYRVDKVSNTLDILTGNETIMNKYKKASMFIHVYKVDNNISIYDVIKGIDLEQRFFIKKEALSKEEQQKREQKNKDMEQYRKEKNRKNQQILQAAINERLGIIGDLIKK